MRKSRGKPRKRGIAFAKPGERDVVLLDFEKIQREGLHYVQGSAADLIRDGHDHPRRWMHNSQAHPDDRKTAWLVGRGYSATPERRKFLRQTRAPVMAINDYPDDPYQKPRYFCTGDPCGYFGERIWNDPEVMKFTPFDFRTTLRPRLDAYAPARSAMDAANVHFFHHVNNETEMESWLHFPWIHWGSTIHGPKVPKAFYPDGAARSSMLIGLRLLWHLGFRRVCLLGCDCPPHAHAAPEYWNTIFYLLEQIKPTFKRFGFEVVQTNPDSDLRVFPTTTFDKAVSA